MSWAAVIGATANMAGQSSANQSTAREARYATEVNLASAKSARKFAKREAHKSRVWQEKMSNTAIQRRTKDLRKAGINPILAAGQSASQPSGATASATAGQAVAAQYKNEMEAGVNSATNILSTQADIKLKTADTADRKSVV